MKGTADREIVRIAIFVDHENFVISYRERNKHSGKNIGSFQTINYSVWSNITENILDDYMNLFLRRCPFCIEHVGTYVCVGMPRFYTDHTKALSDYFDKLDRQNGFIVKYGTRAGSPVPGPNGEQQWGKEKGVDTEIVCQMLMGAFRDHYDVAILMSDDADYLPAVDRVQDFFGKRVIHAGYKATLLRARCYGHIPLERADADLVFRPESQRQSSPPASAGKEA